MTPRARAIVERRKQRKADVQERLAKALVEWKPPPPEQESEFKQHRSRQRNGY